MKRAYFIPLFLCLIPSLFSQSNPVSLIDGYGKLPLSFEANQGQTDPQVMFLSRGTGYNLFLTSNEAMLTLQPSTPSPARPGQAKKGVQPPVRRQPSAGAVLRMKLLNANPKTEVSGQDELAAKSNYFIGNDPKKWHTDVRQFAKVRYQNIYPGVDLVYYGHQRQLEYDFVLRPGANPQSIRLGIAGAKRLRLEHGDLVLVSAGGDVHLLSPRVYQEANGARQEVHGRYVVKSKSEVGFEVAAYDRRRTLVIDPVLAYSTYLGGSGGFYESGNAIAVDSAGNAYVTGQTTSADFPTQNAIQPHYAGGGSDAFVTKFNADGTALLYSTYLGGANDGDYGVGIAVDSSGNAYVAGTTGSPDFPTKNAIQPTYGGPWGDAFVAKISAEGSALVYSTFLGGSSFDSAGGIAVDPAGNAYVSGTTWSTDFPTKNAIQPTYGGGTNAFVAKINSAGTALVFSTYLGGSGDDEGGGIAADAAGNAYVTGSTGSTDFPTKNGIQTTCAAGYDDAFVADINAGGSAFVYSTCLGGSAGDFGTGIAVDAAGNAYVTGYTDSTDFPTKDPIQPASGGNADAFVAKINTGGNTLAYSTYLGGNGNDQGASIAVDTTGNTYVIGTTSSSDFPTKSAIQSTNGGGKWDYYDAFFTEINPQGTALIFSTYLGGKGEEDGLGIAVDSAGSIYGSGKTYAATPTTPVAFQLVRKGGTDAFVAKIAQQRYVGLTASKLGFGTVVIGTTSPEKKVTVTNQDSSTLTINSIFVGGLHPTDFAQTNTCGGRLAPNASCTVLVTFTPTAKNTKRAGLGISSSDPASPDAIALSGNGTVVSLSAKLLAFGKVPVDSSSSPKTVTLTNTGSTQLDFKGISITGTNAGDFAQTNTCGSSIPAGGNCTITVTFTPTATWPRAAAVTIGDDGGGSPQNIALVGTGT